MIYTFKNTETGEIVDVTMKVAEYEDYVKNNPHMERFHGEAPSIGDPVRLGVVKPPSDFQKHVVGRMMETVPNNKIRTKFGVPKEW